MNESVELKKHQKENYNFILSKYKRGFRGAIIGDEMGIGKTISSLFFVQEFIKTNPTAKVLILIPPKYTLVQQWVEEINTYFEEIATELYVIKNKKQSFLINKRVVMLSSSVLGDINYREKFLKHKFFDLVVIDELHNYKNIQSIRTQAIFPEFKPATTVKKRLSEDALKILEQRSLKCSLFTHSKFILGLTGTPFNNGRIADVSIFLKYFMYSTQHIYWVSIAKDGVSLIGEYLDKFSKEEADNKIAQLLAYNQKLDKMIISLPPNRGDEVRTLLNKKIELTGFRGENLEIIQINRVFKDLDNKRTAFKLRLAIDNIMIRHLVEDGGVELPSKVRTCEYVELDDKVYLEYLNEDQLKFVQELTEKFKHIKDFDVFLSMLTQDIHQMIDKIVSNHFIENQKIPAVVEFLEDVYLEDKNTNRKFLIAVSHYNTADKLYDELSAHLSKKGIDKKIRKYHGKISTKIRDQIRIESNENNTIDIIIATRNSISEGISFNNINSMLITSLTWTPAMMTQLEGRIRRMSSVNKTSFYYYFLYENGLDILFKKMLESKNENILKIIRSEDYKVTDTHIN